MPRLVIFALLLGWRIAGGAEIELKGIASQGGTPIFSLYSVEEQTSKWVSVGQSFAGFRAVSFDARREVLTVKSGERSFELRMIPAVIGEANSETAKTEAPDGIVLVRVTRDGVVSGGRVFPLETLNALMAGLDKGGTVRLETGRDVSAGAAIAVLNALRDAGVVRLTLRTPPAP